MHSIGLRLSFDTKLYFINIKAISREYKNKKNTNIYKIYKHITVRQRDDLVYLAGNYPSLADVSRPNYTVRAQDSNGVVSDFG